MHWQTNREWIRDSLSTPSPALTWQRLEPSLLHTLWQWQPTHASSLSARRLPEALASSTEGLPIGKSPRALPKASRPSLLNCLMQGQEIPNSGEPQWRRTKHLSFFNLDFFETTLASCCLRRLWHLFPRNSRRYPEGQGSFGIFGPDLGDGQLVDELRFRCLISFTKRTKAISQMVPKHLLYVRVLCVCQWKS